MTLKFDLTQLQTLNSFGIAGLLHPDSEVFYSPLFNTKHIGRVSDLLAARLEKSGVDEFALRVSLIFSAFQAFRGQVGEGVEQNVRDALVLECGIDREKIAVGISFYLSKSILLNTEGLPDRVTNHQPTDFFERMLADLWESVDFLLLKFQPDTRKAEVVALIGRQKPEGTKPALELVTLEGPEVQEPPKPRAYVAIGDLDYPNLLREAMKPRTRPHPSGEIIVPSAATEGDDEVRVKASRRKGMDETRVGGSRQGLDDEVRISGTTQKFTEELITVKGSKGEAEESLRIAGSGDDFGASFFTTVKETVKQFFGRKPRRVRSGVSQYEEIPQDFGQAPKPAQEEPVFNVPSVPEPVEVSVTVPEPQEPELSMPEPGSGVPARDDLPFDVSGFGEESGTIPESEAVEQEVEAAIAGTAKGKKSGKKGSLAALLNEPAGDSSLPEPSLEEPSEGSAPSDLATSADAQTQPPERSTELDAESKKLLVELETDNLDEIIKKAQTELASGGVKGAAASHWAESLMGRLIGERSRLNDLTKKVNLSLRLKELEFKDKMGVMREEVRRKEATINQKNVALMRAKEQIAQLSDTNVKLKSATQNTSDEATFKQKYEMTHRMLELAKDENIQVMRRLEEVRAQNQASSRGPSTTQHTILQAKYDRLFKQAEEFKKANRQLMERLNDPRRDRAAPAGSTEETRRRLESAMNMVATSKQETEAIRRRLITAQQEEMRLREENRKLQTELKRISATSATAGGVKRSPTGGGGTGGAAGGGSVPPQAA